MASWLTLTVTTAYHLVGNAPPDEKHKASRLIAIDTRRRKFFWATTNVDDPSPQGKAIASVISLAVYANPLSDEEITLYLSPEQVAAALAMCISKS